MNVFTVILAGGRGSGLSVLTAGRAKPAVPVGGKYRLIDFALSNVANSGLDRVALLAQFLPQSLAAHVGAGEPWGFAPGACETWLPSLERTGCAAYSGTADAVYQNRRFIEEQGCELTLVLSGDHLYRQDYRDLVRFHQENGAALTVVTRPVPASAGRRFGMLAADERHKITHFEEKPAETTLEQASMGIYLFNTAFLLERLEEDARSGESTHDFGRDLIPAIVAGGQAWAYPLAGGWAEIGSVEDYWQANLDFLGDHPVLDLLDPRWPVATRLAYPPMPAAIRLGGQVSDSLVSDGCFIAGEVTHSVLSPGVRVERGALVRDAVILSGAVIRAGAVVNRCVVDEAVEVGENAFLGAGGDLTPNEGEPELLKSGLTLVGKGARIPAGMAIGRNCLVEPGVGPEDFAGLLSGTYLPSGKSVRKS